MNEAEFGDPRRRSGARVSALRLVLLFAPGALLISLLVLPGSGARLRLATTNQVPQSIWIPSRLPDGLVLRQAGVSAIPGSPKQGAVLSYASHDGSQFVRVLTGPHQALNIQYPNGHYDLRIGSQLWPASTVDVYAAAADALSQYVVIVNPTDSATVTVTTYGLPKTQATDIAAGLLSAPLSAISEQKPTAIAGGFADSLSAPIKSVIEVADAPGGPGKVNATVGPSPMGSGEPMVCIWGPDPDPKIKPGCVGLVGYIGGNAVLSIVTFRADGASVISAIARPSVDRVEFVDAVGRTVQASRWPSDLEQAAIFGGAIEPDSPIYGQQVKVVAYSGQTQVGTLGPLQLKS
jgi:hypothetical protein